VLLGQQDAPAPLRRRVAVLETALDDDNPQYLAELMSRMIGEGALDAMLAPTVMKKGRPGLLLTVIAEPDHADRFATQLLSETSTLGVRLRLDERYELPRSLKSVETPFGAIRLKVADLPEGGSRAVPEFESVRAAAERAGRPLRDVAEAALAAWSRSGGR
jgi:hypothetical protein